jgi:hypothetical protein
MIEDTVAEGIPIWRRMIEDAGGQWEGVQMPFFCDEGAGSREPICLFLAPFSRNSLSLPISQMTENNVKQKLGIPNVSKQTQFQKMEELQKRIGGMTAALRDIAYQIDEEIKNAEK